MIVSPAGIRPGQVELRPGNWSENWTGFILGGRALGVPLRSSATTPDRRIQREARCASLRRFLALVYLVAPPCRCLTRLPGRRARWRSPMRCGKSAARAALADCESSWTTHPNRSQSATKSPRFGQLKRYLASLLVDSSEGVGLIWSFDDLDAAHNRRATRKPRD